MLCCQQGNYFSLATSKGGSRALEALWQSVDVKCRMTIAEELLQKEAALTGNQFGLIIFHKFTLSLFRHQKVDWKAMQEKEGKKRKLFSGLVGKLAFYLIFLRTWMSHG